jgi:hypothetical protein
LVTLNASGEALVEFHVGMQPGNNYRVAATVFPTNNLGSLQSGAAAGDYFVSAYTDQIRGGFNGALSPLLTVWRKLHLEFDSMGTAIQSPRTSSIVVVQQNGYGNGKTLIHLPSTTTITEHDALRNGTLQVGETSYRIWASYSLDRKSVV